jgi:hypothetical protein
MMEEPPRLTVHAALRWVERAAGLLEDADRARREIAQDRGVQVRDVPDADVLKRLGVDMAAISRRIITPSVVAAVRAGATSISIDGITFMIRDNAICTVVDGRFERGEGGGMKRAAQDNFGSRKARKATRKAKRKANR